MGGSARGHPPRGRCPGAGEVDSRERRLVGLDQRPGSTRITQHKESRPKVTSRLLRGAVMKPYAWAMLGLGRWVAGGEGGTRWLSSQTPPPNIGPQQNRPFNP